MKFLNKLFTVLLTLVLIVSFAACGGKKDNNSSDKNSKPAESTSTGNTTQENKPEENNSDTNKPDDNKQEESKPQQSTPSETSKPQKNYAKIIVGNWIAKIDAAEILAEFEYDFTGPIYIDFAITFGNDNSYTEYINEANTTSALKTALGSEYDDDFIANCVNTLSDAMFATGVYKLENNILSIKMDDQPEYTDVDYSFKTDTKLTLSVMSDELEFTKK